MQRVARCHRLALRGWVALALLVGAMTSLPAGGLGAGPQDPQTSGRLTEAPGVELVRERCLLCHSEDVVISQNLARARWDELLDWMEQTQGMAELPADIRAGILDYLEATQPPRELSIEDSPWASPRYRPNPVW